MIPGEIITAPGDIELNAGPRGDHPHRRQHRRPADPGRLALPFRRNQCALQFDRDKARGMRLDIPAGTAVRFEPGQTREVQLVPFAGSARSTASGKVMGRLCSATACVTMAAEHLDGWRNDADENFPRRLRRYVRPDHRRQGAARRHRARRRGREGLHHLWRGGEVRRRQGDPRRHGAEPGHAAPRARSTPSSPTR